MPIKVKISDGCVDVNEWHQECTTILGREIGGNLSGREEPWRALDLKTQKLMDWLTATRDNFTWQPDFCRTQYQISSVRSGKPIDAPIMYAELDVAGSIKIIDGRHRITALHELGAATIPVMVPMSQVSLFSITLG